VPDIHELFDQIVAAYTREPGVTFGRAWHNEGLTVDGRIFAMVVRDGLVVKVPADQAADLIEQGRGTAFEPRPGRTMREWIVVDGHDPTRWRRLIADAHHYVGEC
jgi:hypothetical protein